jgi:ubiquinone biosynthesis protein
MGPVGRAQSGLEALRVVSDVVGDIPDLATRLKRVLIRLDETGNSDARRLEKLAREERYRAIWSTLALWGIAIGALVMAFRSA